MIVIMEDVYDQILKQNILKDDHIYRHRAQTALKAFTYNYLDLDVKQLFNDRKKIKTLQNLRDRCMILKPDKGQGIVLINKMDYYQSLERLFGDRKKFQVLDHDPTLTNLVTIRNYIQTIYKRGEITETEMKEIRPKAAQVGRAHGLPKIHKKYTDLPSFRPIIDTTNTPHYGVGKFLTRLLNPLTQNVYSIKDSFEAVDRIRSMPTELFDESYRYFFFDVTSLFTNVPLNNTINIILHRIYKENIVKTNMRKSTLKKLIKGSCTKTAFSFDGRIYKQIDGVFMGLSLGPVLANVTLTEF